MRAYSKYMGVSCELEKGELGRLKGGRLEAEILDKSRDGSTKSTGQRIVLVQEGSCQFVKEKYEGEKRGDFVDVDVLIFTIGEPDYYRLVATELGSYSWDYLPDCNLCLVVKKLSGVSEVEELARECVEMKLEGN
ncbi:MAG: hypothetical protein ABIG28_00780 [archaeon]